MTGKAALTFAVAALALAAVVVPPLPALAQAAGEQQPAAVPSPSSPAPAAPAAPESAPPGAVAPPVAGGEPGYYLGVGTCLGSGCHGATRPQAEGEVLGNEYYTWLQQDSHQGAYNVLFNDQSRLIVRNLGLRGPAQRTGVCLDCHATHVPAGRRKGPLELVDGVSCEACHGPASGWRDAHTEPGWSHEQSVGRGLVDLRLPAVRAGVCLGCHLGDPTRTVDHALLAAGHPRLVFELDNYAQSMPPHWKPEPSEGVGAWAVGQVVAFRAGLAQLSRRARAGAWPEFSELSCQACHHSLDQGKWRQQRGYAGRVRPGLPPWSPARWAALRQLVAVAAPEERDALGRDVSALAAAVEPMNRPAEAAAVADRLAAAVDRLVPRVAAADWSAAGVRKLIAALAADRAFVLATDVDSAEQIFFAAQTLSSSLVAGDARLARGEIPLALNRLYGALQDPARYDPSRFADLLAALARAVGGG
jgi:Cytochrome c554 and c-prime